VFALYLPYIIFHKRKTNIYASLKLKITIFHYEVHETQRGLILRWVN